jgi:2-oxoglutarate/2-oxoacid ferredoxin oxidoreductase subunit beta
MSESCAMSDNCRDGCWADFAGEEPRTYTLGDYDGGTARWCPGCGDFAVLSAMQRICRDEGIPPERLAVVSGIGCSSRFPHYVHAYGFHGLHGRALPVACGVKSRRPDLDVWVATGDGDCCSIGAGHWLHAARYNMNMVVMLFDNAIYGLTKKQSSPTTPIGFGTNTHPDGSWLPPLDPVRTMLGFANISFVARTVDRHPPHLYETLRAAYHHQGTSFVHILQRCPTYTPDMFEVLRREPERMLFLEHADGISGDGGPRYAFPNREAHDPTDHMAAHTFAARRDAIPIGLFYRDATAPRYDLHTAQGVGQGSAARLAALERELDRFAV